MARAWRYPLLAIPISAGAPLGWLTLRLLGRTTGAPLIDWLVAEVRGSLALYLYLGISTTIVAVAIGRVTGALTDRLEKDALTDSLTGLRNRRFLEARLVEEMARTRRAGSSLAMLLLDLDHFKAINDTRGHDVGDSFLRKLGLLVLEEVRVSDVAARPAGDEFAILLTDTTREQATALAERLRARTIERLRGATLSIGVAVFSPDAHATPRDFFRAVDQALYEAKSSGRNTTRSA